ncbi:MAG: SiaB family protein kinase [Flavobacteriales bacterium]|nr:SiaB family protein kinase [Flavobacteriales bacterium]
MDLDIFGFYDKMEESNILLSFKGEITSDLLTSILQIMESKLENFEERSRTKKKVYNVLVECLQNLYHHVDEVTPVDDKTKRARTAIFMIGKDDENYNIMTGNYILSENIEPLTAKMDRVNSMTVDQLKVLYKEILNNDQFSSKGGGGLGLVDIARRTGQKLGYNFKAIDEEYAFFSLEIRVRHKFDD